MLMNQWLWKGISTVAILGAAFAVSGDLPWEVPQAAAPIESALAVPAPAPVPVTAPNLAATAALPTVAPTLASSNGFAVRGVLAPDRPMGAGDYAWEATGVPPGS
jgi:hypothetical protein